MDNILFVPSVRESEWVQTVLPGLSPAELPVAGKRIVDYALECAERQSAVFMEILDWHYSKRLAADYSDLTRTRYPAFYVKGDGAIPRGLRDMEGLSTPLTQTISDGLVVIWGLFPGAPPGGFSPVPATEDECADTPPGIYLRQRGRWMRLESNGTTVDSVGAWHRLNFEVLHHAKELTIPGYSTEKDVHIGRNVVMERGTKVKAPVLLNDNVWCARNVRLEGDVIIGSGTFIAEGAVLRDTVVCGDTYIGAGLALEDKIVFGRRIIDARTGAWVDVDDEGIARCVRRIGGLGWLRGVWRFLVGKSRGRRY